MTDREAADLALKKLIECLAYMDKLDQRVKTLEALMVDLLSALNE
ncbi:MAG TPA: hypothetical protein VGW40_02865 [Allosphingosinicella sp.]|nr:hypothetical protein [Allosphingosinicella sp.]